MFATQHPSYLSLSALYLYQTLPLSLRLFLSLDLSLLRLFHAVSLLLLAIGPACTWEVRATGCRLSALSRVSNRWAVKDKSFLISLGDDTYILGSEEVSMVGIGDVTKSCHIKF